MTKDPAHTYPYDGEHRVKTLDSGDTAATDDLFRFTEKQRDAEPSQDYFGARYYADFLGPFTSEDPSREKAHTADPQSGNRYSYWLKNLLKFVDPDGLEVVDANILESVAGLTIIPGPQQPFIAESVAGLAAIVAGKAIDGNRQAIGETIARKSITHGDSTRPPVSSRPPPAGLDHESRSDSSASEAVPVFRVWQPGRLKG